MLVPPRRPVSDTGRNPLEPWREGDVWIHPVTGLRLRVEQSASESKGESLVVVITYPPNSPEPPLHLHPSQTERFTILHGVLRIATPRGSDDVKTNDSREIGRAQPHATWNPHQEPAVARWETKPALKTERSIGLMFSLAAAGRTDRHGQPRPLQLAVLMAACRREIRLHKPAPWIQMLLLPFVLFLGRCRSLRLARVAGSKKKNPARR